MTGLIVLAVYVGIFVASMVLFTRIGAGIRDYTSLKTVTFGDESAVRPNRAAGVISLLTLFLLWGMFTGSSLIPASCTHLRLSRARRRLTILLRRTARRTRQL